ncbi:hypothetical protein CASFOL_041228 [Castilleja foliolosa]|uniref:Uncharacterized protein n=1 Tax=Castilleja foliolosa TaxID=1961234 RepID=A0ABD3BE13_9LAMI
MRRRPLEAAGVAELTSRNGEAGHPVVIPVERLRCVAGASGGLIHGGFGFRHRAVRMVFSRRQMHFGLGSWARLVKVGDLQINCDGRSTNQL